MNKLISQILAIALLLSLSACSAPALMFTSLSGSGVALTKKKTVGDTVDDFNIWTKIKADFVKHNKELPGVLTNVSVEVSEGRVLLTGKIGTADERLKILRIAWDQAGVHEVINEIQLEDEVEKVGINQYATDTWITTQVKSKMLTHKEIHSLNYNIETINGVVYVLGIADSQQEIQALVFLAEAVKNVHKVIAYVRVVDKAADKIDSAAQPKEPETQPETTIIDKEEAFVPINPDQEIDPETSTPETDEEIIEIGKDTE